MCLHRICTGAQETNNSKVSFNKTVKMYRFIVLLTLVVASQSLNVEVSDETVTLWPQKARELTISSLKDRYSKVTIIHLSEFNN